MIDVGLIHLPQKLARVSGERFDVPPLPLRVYRIEGEARFARARNACEYYEFIPGKLERDVFEVVLPSPLDKDPIVHFLVLCFAFFL